MKTLFAVALVALSLGSASVASANTYDDYKAAVGFSTAR